MKIKIVTFNIRCCDDKNGHSIDERAPRLKKILDREAPDVIGFQECVPNWERHFERDYLDKYGMYLVHRAQKDAESCPILWRKDKFNCVDKGMLWLSDTPDTESRGWDELYNCYRICLWIILEDKSTGERFLHMNTHFGFGDNGQSKSARLIIERMGVLPNLPTALTGDFNLVPDSPGYKVLTATLTDVNSTTAKDWGITYHNYGEDFEMTQHIDYCFTNAKMKPLSYTLLDDTFDGKYPSDHYGLSIELEAVQYNITDVK